MSKRPWAFDPPPLRCRLGWHRWEASWQDGEWVSGSRCARTNCIAERPTAAKRDSRPTVDYSDPWPPRAPGEDYWVRCWRHDGTLVYSGPIPVPDDIDAISAADAQAGRFNTYEVTLVEFEETDA